jgi:cysteine desulfurase/selenocysteine lyase
VSATLIDTGRVKSPCTGKDVSWEQIRDDFPILRHRVHGKPLVYFDNAASTQKPQCVIDSERRVYEESYANVHRGVHDLSQRCSADFEAARDKARTFVNAARREEIIFVRGATEAINLVAFSYGARVKAGDEILISGLEHHSNIVPWQLLCERTGAHLRVAPIDDRGEIILEELEKLLGPKTRLVGVGHVSNALGTVNPVKRIIEMAHAVGAVVLVDGAQAAPHLTIDVQDLGCDFYALSGHKVYGPSGIGLLYGRAELLDSMPPYQGGGEMILSVSFEKTTYNVLPYKFEAGTPNIAGTIALGAAFDYVRALGMQRIRAHEQDLLEYATEAVSRIPDLRIIGTAREKAGVLSFVIEGIHAHDVGTILDHEGIAVRTGHHCAQPVMDRFGVPATARASFGLYNTRAEVDALINGIQKVIEVFA